MNTDSHPLIRSLSLAVHEFRTPVTVLAGYLRMLLREQAGPLTDKQRKMLEEADRSCSRLGALVNEMSDLGRLESRDLTIARQDVDLNALVPALAADVHEGEDRGVRLEVRNAEGPLIVLGDRTRLSLALKALMHAAVRERGEPGTIVVECFERAADGGWAVVAIGESSRLEWLREAGDHAPYDEWQSGLGLSLPVARRIIEAHGGALWSDPRTHSRAAAALRLPLRAREAGGA
jgi:signal transduction histidine kinase